MEKFIHGDIKVLLAFKVKINQEFQSESLKSTSKTKRLLQFQQLMTFLLLYVRKEIFMLGESD